MTEKTFKHPPDVRAYMANKTKQYRERKKAGTQTFKVQVQNDQEKQAITKLLDDLRKKPANPA